MKDCFQILNGLLGPVASVSAILFLARKMQRKSTSDAHYMPGSEDHYQHLTSLLHPVDVRVIEIDILPSQCSQVIQHESSAIAIPKSLLVQCFLIARKAFFVPDITSTDTARDQQLLQATDVILLWDPNHVTAANWRKRYLKTLHESPSSLDDPNGINSQNIKVAIERELAYTESLLTSPLTKHTKASTLWAHRVWVISHFADLLLPTKSAEELGELWGAQMAIVLKAGERHPKNYYAWNHLRQLYEFLVLKTDSKVDSRLVLCSIEHIHKWCLMHPRDISGWSFMAYSTEMLAAAFQADVEVSKNINNAVVKIYRETEMFVHKYDWTGESMEWFLNFFRLR